MPRKQIHYNNSHELAIVKSVKIIGAHLAGHGDVSAKWLEVNKTVFDTDAFRNLKADHYKEDDYQKIKSKYDSIVKKVKATNGWGDFLGGTCQNLSGFEGELGEVIKSTPIT